jgi:hypothetical protein
MELVRKLLEGPFSPAGGDDTMVLVAMTLVVGRRGRIFILGLLVFLAGCGGVEIQDLVSKPPLPDGSCVVVGFLGGRDRWNDEDKGVGRLALRLRDSERNIFVETFENRRRNVAEEFVLQALGDERAQRPLVVYGQSFGGAAVLKFARSLERLSIPIALTVQVDSVGRGDGLVPTNVRFALNLYQSDGWFIRGEQPIRSEDPGETVILGNRQFHYDRPPGSEIDVADVPWWKLDFRIPHARMDRDEQVWDLAGNAIRAACAGEDLVAVFRH